MQQTVAVRMVTILLTLTSMGVTGHWRRGCHPSTVPPPGQAVRAPADQDHPDPASRPGGHFLAFPF